MTKLRQGNGRGEVLLPIGMCAQKGSQRRGGVADGGGGGSRGETAQGDRGAEEEWLGLYLFRGVEADGEPVSLPREEGGDGTGVSGKRVRIAVADACALADVPPRHVVLSRVMR